MASAHSSLRLVRLFLVTAALMGLAGMLLGLTMGVLEDFRLKGVHVHVNLIGFVTLFLAGLFYRVFPAAAGRLAWAQYGATTLGVALMAPGLVGIYFGLPALAWMTKPASLLVVAGMLFFVWNVVAFAGVDDDSAQSGSGGRGASFKVIDDSLLHARQEAARIIREAARSAQPQPA